MGHPVQRNLHGSRAVAVYANNGISGWIRYLERGGKSFVSKANYAGGVLGTMWSEGRQSDRGEGSYSLKG